MMKPLRVDRQILIESEALSVSFTRELEHDGPEAARHAPTHVEFRLDIRHCDALSQEQKDLLLATPGLKANRRGIIRVFCREHRTRAANLDGARHAMVQMLRAVLFPKPGDDAPPETDAPKPKRRGGLIKRSGS